MIQLKNFLILENRIELKANSLLALLNGAILKYHTINTRHSAKISKIGYTISVMDMKK